MGHGENVVKKTTSPSLRGISALTLLLAPALVILDAIVLKTCARGNDETESEGVVLTVSGAIVDAEQRPLQGVTLTLNGSDQATTRSGSNGTYSISTWIKGTPGTSWSVRPSLDGCQFAPSIFQLSGPTRNAVGNFIGSGEKCAGLPAGALGTSPVDRGPRPGPPGAGSPPLHGDRHAAEQAAARACLSGLAFPMMALCAKGLMRFQEVASVSGTLPGETGGGLGPTFSGNSCAMCHAQPAVLGSSPSVRSPQNPLPNPQVALATRDGARNSIPPFVTLDDPVREVLFKSDNDIHALFTIAGRSDARGCGQEQPDFAENLRRDNIRFRIPLALFGLGLVEAMSEATLSANLAASSNSALGIAGSFNRSNNEGTIARFGWKAQHKSILIFAGEAYNTEMGVTNELFPQEREAAEGCSLNATPEDAPNPRKEGTLSDNSSDVENFAFAIRLSAPPTPEAPPGVPRSSLENGERQFRSLGCSNCHTPSLTTSTSNLDPALSDIVIHPFSDFAIHHMGSGLADGIQQGSAGPDQFRTAPLWGVGQRLFFLHDGRTTDLVAAIAAHASSGSEANTVIANFQKAGINDAQDLVDFLRSL
jgi:CxxC motif-containing protein (DUF1111 family)